MDSMFFNCSSLKELNLNNFNANNVTKMQMMFYKCSSLKELNFNNFIINNGTYMFCIFSGCSYELKNKIRNLNPNIKEHAFYEN